MVNNVGVVVIVVIVVIRIIIIIIIEVNYFYQNAQSCVGNKQTYCVHLFIFWKYYLIRKKVYTSCIKMRSFWCINNGTQGF